MIVVGTQAPPNRHPPKVTGSSRQYFRWWWFRRSSSSSSFSLSSSSSLKCVNLPSFVRTAGSRPNTVFRAVQHHHRHTRGEGPTTITNNNKSFKLDYRLCTVSRGHTRAPVFGVGRFFFCFVCCSSWCSGDIGGFARRPLACAVCELGCCVVCCFVLKNVEEANNFKLPLEPLLPKLISRCAFIILDFYFLLVCLLALMGSIFN